MVLQMDPSTPVGYNLNFALLSDSTPGRSSLAGLAFSLLRIPYTLLKTFLGAWSSPDLASLRESGRVLWRLGGAVCRGGSDALKT